MHSKLHKIAVAGCAPPLIISAPPATEQKQDEALSSYNGRHRHNKYNNGNNDNLKPPTMNAADQRRLSRNSVTMSSSGGRQISVGVRKISTNSATRKISFVMAKKLSTFSRAPNFETGIVEHDGNSDDDDADKAETTVLAIDEGDLGNEEQSVEYGADALGNYSPQIRSNSSGKLSIVRNSAPFNRAKKHSFAQIVANESNPQAAYNPISPLAVINTRAGVARPRYISYTKSSDTLGSEECLPQPNKTRPSIESDLPTSNDVLQDGVLRHRVSVTLPGGAQTLKATKISFPGDPVDARRLAAAASTNHQQSREEDERTLLFQSDPPVTIIPHPNIQQQTSLSLEATQPPRIRSVSYAFQYGREWQADEEGYETDAKNQTLFRKLCCIFTAGQSQSNLKCRRKRSQHASLCTKCDRLIRKFGAVVGGEEWLFLVILGIIMAILSYVIDMVSDNVLTTRLAMYDMTNSMPLKAFIWLSIPLALTMLATTLTNRCAPQAIGSGIPEMKTILHGVILKDYLSMPTLITKYFGLMLMLSTGLPIGKVGPFVHIGSMVARQLNRLRAYLISHSVDSTQNRKRRGSGGAEGASSRYGSRHSPAASHVVSKQPDSASGIYSTSRSMLVETAGKYETLAAGCATGVAAAFAAPIGGVLFSIEATSVYFAVKNYWRGFFAAVCAALTFLLLGVLMRKQVTLLPVIQTKFPVDFPFDPTELLMFALVGVICGITGAVFVKLHRQVVLTQRRYLPRRAVPYFVYAYPFAFCVLYLFVTFPDGMGHYMAGRLAPRNAMVAFFSDSDIKEHIKPPQQKLQESAAAAQLNVTRQLLQILSNHTIGGGNGTAYKRNETRRKRDADDDDDDDYFVSPAHFGYDDDEDHDDIRQHVADYAPEVPIILIIALYALFNYFTVPISISLPVPAGVFMPTFVIGCSIGRLIGEIIAHYFPNGIADPDVAGGVRLILPGAYAVVGAAAFSGAVTQTISTSVIATEMTGQMAHILPVLIATLIANYVARRVGELSIFDSIIRLKRLPFLPQLDLLSDKVHHMKVEDIMMRTVQFVTLCDLYEDVRRVLTNAPPTIRVLPLVDSPDTMVLVGAISRRDLHACVEEQLNFRRYLAHLDAEQTRVAPAEIVDQLLVAKQEAEHAKIVSDDDGFVFGTKPVKTHNTNQLMSSNKPAAVSPVITPTVTSSVSEANGASAAETTTIGNIRDGYTQNEPVQTRPRENSSQADDSDRLFLSDVNDDSSSSSSTSSSSNAQQPSQIDQLPFDRYCVWPASPPSTPAEPIIIITHKPTSSQTHTEKQQHLPSRFRVTRIADHQNNSTMQHPNSWLPLNFSVNETQPASRIEPQKAQDLYLNDGEYRRRGDSEASKKFDQFCNIHPTSTGNGPAASSSGENSFYANEGRTTTAFETAKSCPVERPMDHVTARIAWERQMLEQPCDFDDCSVDVSPMQVVENMSISKLHRLFSLLGLQTVYATSLGRLVGVVTVGDLRRALQEASKK